MNKKVMTEITVGTTRITDRKLTGVKDYTQWKRTITRYINSVDLGDHLSNNPPPRDDQGSRKKWMMVDYKLFNLIQNTLDSTIDDIVTHCDTVKEMWEYLESMYASKQDLTHIHNLLSSYYRPQRKGCTFFQYYNECKQICEEKRSRFPMTADVKQMQEDDDRIFVLGFLEGLSPEFEIARSQILTSGTLPSFADLYGRLLPVCKDIEKTSDVMSQETMALVSNATHGVQSGPQNSSTHRISQSGPQLCHHCGKEGYIKKNCWKLHGRPQKSTNRKFAHIAAGDGILPSPQSSSSTPTVTISVDEYARLQQLSLDHGASQSATTALANTGNRAACLSTSSRSWVIDSGATDHMTGNTGSWDETEYW
ncbi:uncharacterized protein [Euphorbia lathyris]|uniref:uncharacterized protein n=1 Tax=Euphorbia lathyris TaxID=212925 RepID=UPI00331381EC